MKEKMLPRGDCLYVRPFVEEFDGRIVIPDKHKQALTYGEVMAIGSGVSKDIAVGKRVFFSNWAGVKFNKDNPREIIQLRDSEVISISDDDGVTVEVGSIGFCREK